MVESTNTESTKGGDLLAQVAADIEILTVGAEAFDFEIRKDPPKAGETFAGQLASAVTSTRYLFDLSGYLDWGASKDMEKSAAATDPEEIKKYRNYSRRGRRQAAVCRYYARKMLFTNKRGNPF